MTSHPMTELMKKVDAQGFGDCDSLFWATKFYDAGGGFFVRGLAATPMFGQGVTELHWVPREPTALELARLDPVVVRQVTRAIEMRLRVHYFIAHDLFTTDGGVGA